MYITLEVTVLPTIIVVLVPTSIIPVSYTHLDVYKRQAGTVGENLEAIVKELLAGRFEFKNDKQGNVHSIVGKLSFGNAKLKDNIAFFVKTMK